MTTLNNSNITKAIEISKRFARETTDSKEVFEKFIEQLENAVLQERRILWIKIFFLLCIRN